MMRLYLPQNIYFRGGQISLQLVESDCKVRLCIECNAEVVIMSKFDDKLPSTGPCAHIVAVVLKMLGTHNIVGSVGRIVIIRCYEHHAIIPFRQMRMLIMNTAVLETSTWCCCSHGSRSV